MCNVHYDNQSIIHLANRQIYHERTKHIDIILPFMRHVIKYGEVRINKIALEENPTDVFTKSLSRSRFRRCLELVNG